MYEKLPDNLKRNARFCLWRYEMRKGKPTKVPYRTDGRRADSTKASDFSSFDAVTSVLKKGNTTVSEMTVGNTLFTVISVQSEYAKETPCDKVKRLILEHSRDIPDSATKNSQ